MLQNSLLTLKSVDVKMFIFLNLYNEYLAFYQIFNSCCSLSALLVGVDASNKTFSWPTRFLILKSKGSRTLSSCHFGAPQCWPGAKSFAKSLGVLKVENSPFYRRAGARKILWQHKWLVYRGIYFLPPSSATPPPAYHIAWCWGKAWCTLHTLGIYSEPRYIHLGVCIFACRYVLCTREAAARRHKVSRAN